MVAPQEQAVVVKVLFLKKSRVMNEEMRSKRLVIVFVKNAKLGQVKTRLASSIGNEEALYIYNRLVDITEQATASLPMDKCIAYSESIDNSRWPTDRKIVQSGNDLGEKMKNAFERGFADGYHQIVLIGSDLPDISSEIIANAFEKLNDSETVFGPAEDGGYYLIGMSKMNTLIFENKPWSQPELLDITLKELSQNRITTRLLNPLDDVDTLEDLKKSHLYAEYANRNTKSVK